MSLRASLFLVAVIPLLTGLQAGRPVAAAPPAGATLELPIDDYLDDDDDAYHWEVVKGGGGMQTPSSE